MSRSLKGTKPADGCRRSSKVRLVPIAQMRNATAGVTQRRFSKAQAEDYAANLDLNKLGIPIVNHRDGIYWVLDGQHRIWALKANGFEECDLECEVYSDLTDSEAADVFLGRDDRRAISLFEKFNIACTANRPRESDIRRTVESQGLKVSQAGETGCVSAVGALAKVYDKGGAVVLGQVLRIIRDAYAADATAFDGQIIQGLGLVFHRYNLRLSEHELAARLGRIQYGARGLLQRAEAMRERTGNQKAICVAATVVDIFNRTVRGPNRLPSWWKGQDEPAPEPAVETKRTRTRTPPTEAGDHASV